MPTAPTGASKLSGRTVCMSTVPDRPWPTRPASGVLYTVTPLTSSDGYWSNYWLKAPVHFGNINPRPTPDILFSLLYASTAPWNESQYKSEKFDKMLLEARGSLDEAQRKRIYDEMQVMVANEAGTAIPVYISNVDAISNKLKGLLPNPLGGMMGYAFAEYVWLDR